MDYNNILKNYVLIKNKINKLLNVMDRNYVKNELDKINDINLRKIVKCQYLYLFQKKMNLLKNNRSLIIIQLEYNIKNIENKSINEIMKILNKLGYNDLLLLLLNIPKKIVDKIKNATGNNEIKYNLLEEDNIETEDNYMNKLITQIAENVVDKYKDSINIGSNNVNIIYKKKIEDEEELNKKYEETMEDEEDEEEEEEDEEEEGEEEEGESNMIEIKKSVKNIIPTFMDKEEEEEVEGDEIDENGNKKKVKEIKSQKIVLSKDDMDLLNKLDNL
jgi:hypothetical protein